MAGTYFSTLALVFLGLYFNFAERIIAGGYYKELAILFPYIVYFAGYRLFRIFIKQLLSSYSFYQYDRSFELDRQKLDWTSKFFSNVFFIVIIVLHTLASARGRGFLYLWIADLFQYFLVFIVFYITSKWFEEIRLVSQKSFSERFLDYISLINSVKSKWFFSFPLLIILIIKKGLAACYGFLEKFDFFRAISAQYFRKKVETSKVDQSLTQTVQDLPIEFLELYYSVDDTKFKLRRSQEEIYQSLLLNISHWRNEYSDEHIALVYGEKGVGKTFLLKRIFQDLEGTEKLFYGLSERVGAKEQLNQIAADAGEKKQQTVVFVDGLQNLFLFKRKGFEHFKEFLKMTQSDKLEHVFWCLGINNYSWEFIEAVLNKNRYFNFIYKVARWREEDIQSWLLSKSKETNYDITYDEVLFSTTRVSESEEVRVEAKYFRILWEEAMGNPSVAQKIWLESLKAQQNTKLIAKVPKERKEFLIDLPDEFYFVLACIVRHQSMSVSEIIEPTDLSEDIVRNSVKKCIEKGYLVKKDSSKVTVSLISQHAVYSILKRMNFIYG
jgi:hypothetical protein